MHLRLLKLLLPLVSLPLVGRPVWRLCTRLAGPYKARRLLINLSGRSLISPNADIRCPQLQIGPRVFIDDHVTIYAHHSGGYVHIAADASLQRYTILELAQGGNISIGQNTHIQSGCNLTAAKASIRIGANVQLAPRCALYPYQHGFHDLATPILEQPITSKGDIVIEEDAWLGVGVIVLDGVTVGRGAVIGAGAVVTYSIPPYAIAAGAPARVIGYRGQPDSRSSTSPRS